MVAQRCKKSSKMKGNWTISMTLVEHLSPNIATKSGSVSIAAFKRSWLKERRRKLIWARPKILFSELHRCNTILKMAINQMLTSTAPSDWMTRRGRGWKIPSQLWLKPLWSDFLMSTRFKILSAFSRRSRLSTLGTFQTSTKLMISITSLFTVTTPRVNIAWVSPLVQMVMLYGRAYPSQRKLYCRRAFLSRISCKGTL